MGKERDWDDISQAAAELERQKLKEYGGAILLAFKVRNATELTTQEIREYLVSIRMLSSLFFQRALTALTLEGYLQSEESNTYSRTDKE